jgi:hypothetical protein
MLLTRLPGFRPLTSYRIYLQNTPRTCYKPIRLIYILAYLTLLHMILVRTLLARSLQDTQIQ